MKKLLIVAAALPCTVLAQTKKPVAKPKVNTVKQVMKNGLDSLSYALGTRIALNLTANNIDTLNYNQFVEGLRDVFKKKELLLDDNQCNNIINSEIQKMATKSAAKEKAASAKFLAENKKRPGVITTASGLQYEVITMGSGIKPTIEDTVVCHYAGTLINGKEFDNSYKRGEPISFPVNGVIKGWTEALQLMPKGSKWKLYIPSDLGYGDRGAGGDIPGGAALIFEVELVDVKVKQ